MSAPSAEQYMNAVWSSANKGDVYWTQSNFHNGVQLTDAYKANPSYYDDQYAQAFAKAQQVYMSNNSGQEAFTSATNLGEPFDVPTGDTDVSTGSGAAGGSTASSGTSTPGQSVMDLIFDTSNTSGNQGDGPGSSITDTDYTMYAVGAGIVILIGAIMYRLS